MAGVGFGLALILLFLGFVWPYMTRDREKQEERAMRGWLLIIVALAIYLVAVLLFRLISAIAL